MKFSSFALAVAPVAVLSLVVLVSLQSRDLLLSSIYRVYARFYALLFVSL